MTSTSVTEQNEAKINQQKKAKKILYLFRIKIVTTAGLPFTGSALKVAEPYVVKNARTVLRGRKLPG